MIFGDESHDKTIDTMRLIVQAERNRADPFECTISLGRRGERPDAIAVSKCELRPSTPLPNGTKLRMNIASESAMSSLEFTL